MSKVICVLPKGRDYSGMMEDWLEDFYRRTGKRIEMIDPETKEGEVVARSYDVTWYPTLIALTGEGKVREVWRGLPLPKLDEVGFYMLEARNDDADNVEEDETSVVKNTTPVSRIGKSLTPRG